MSSFTLLSVLLADLRIHLQEATAHKWTDAQLTQYINEAHRDEFVTTAQMPWSGWGRETETFTVAASTEVYDLSGLTRTFHSVWKLWHQVSTGVWEQMVPMADEQIELHRLANDATRGATTTPGYTIEREAQTENLVILPAANATATYKIKYIYEPPVLTSSDQLHTPSRWDRLIRKIAEQMALADKSIIKDGLFEEIELLRARMHQEEGRALDQSGGHRIGSNLAEDLFFTGRRSGGSPGW